MFRRWLSNVRRKNVSLALGAVILGLASVSPVRADPIGFSPTGNGVAAFTFDGFDPNVGNTLSINALPAIFGGAGNNFETLYQATLSAFNLGGSGVGGTGLNSSYQITFTGRIPEQVSSVVGPVSGIGVAKFTINPALAGAYSPTQNFFEIWIRNPGTADDLAGTGFAGPAGSGIRILSGHFTSVDPKTTLFTSDLNSIQDFDKAIQPTPTDNYPAIDSVSGTGNADVRIAIDTFDSKYFIPPAGQTLTGGTIAFTLPLLAPFTQQNPSAKFTGTAQESGSTSVTPNIGTINGLNGNDFQFQSDATGGLSTVPLQIIPEPTSIVIVGLAMGGFGLVRVIRRRKKTAA